MHLEPYRLIKDPPLSEDYIRYFDKLRDRFDYDPHEDTTWCERAEWLDLQADSRADRQSVAARLLEYNERISNDPAALKAASTLAEERTLAVVGGQQAGLFTGPLLVIYKAITIIRTARQLAAQLDRPVVPVFWIAGEDHDWEEVDHIYQLTPEMRVEKLRLDLDITQRRPVSDVEIPNSEWEHILAQMRATSIDTEFSAPLFERLGELASQSRTLVDLFARMLAWLFGPYGLVLLDSADPELRKLESSMMERIVRYSESLANRLVAGSDAVRTLGYQIQAEPELNSSNLFVVQNGERVLLFREGDRFVDRDGSITWNSAQLIDTIRRSPHLFSNNVLTRPLVQEYLLPVAAAVVGRSEAAYWAQLREAFHLMEMKMPPVVLRHEYTLLDKTVEKHMDKFGLSLEDVMYRFDEKKAEWLKEQDELDLDGLFAETKQRLRELYVPVVRQVATLDPGLKSLGHTNMNKLIEQVEFLEKRAKNTLVSRNKAALRQMNRIVQNLHPLNRPQERVFNVVHYINKFGDGFLHELLRLDTVPGEYHYILRLN